MDEATRQQALLAAIFARDDGQALKPELAHRPAGVRRGLQAYQANAGASAERALAAAFPTVCALVGAESFASLARVHHRACPPLHGDLGRWGDGLAAFIAGDEQLAEVPYLADAARLDWLMAQAERAADAVPEVQTFGLLAEHDPDELRLTLMPGLALLTSEYPVVAIWQAHQPEVDVAALWRSAQAALAARQGDNALVWRSGWRAQVKTLDTASARWMGSLLGGHTLAQALTDAGAGFDFAAWLAQAVEHQWVLRVTVDARAA